MMEAALLVANDADGRIERMHVFRPRGNTALEDVASGANVDVHEIDTDRTPVSLSDACVDGDLLYLLFRCPGVILVYDRKGGDLRPVAWLSYRKTELDPRFEYRKDTRPFGVMEGMAVAGGVIYLCADNNGEALVSNEKEHRPVLLRFRNPVDAARSPSRAGGGIR
jgi:hypothetical protein